MTMLDTQLLIATPTLGTLTETFIHRHIAGLAPGQTHVMAKRCQGELPAAATLLPYGRARNARRILTRRLTSGHGCGWTPPPAAHRRFEELLGDERPDAILFEYLDQWLDLLPAAQRSPARVVVHSHGYDHSACLRCPKQQERYRELDQADHVVVVNRVAEARLVDLGIAAEKVSVVPYGVEPNTEADDHPGAGTTLDPARINVVSIGRFGAKKSPTSTISAFAEAHRSVPDLALTMAGTGDLLEECQELAVALGVEESVTFLGPRPHGFCRTLLASADVFALHSVTDPITGDEEGLPLVILEAMAAAVPIVSTVHAGIPDAVTDGVNGYLVPEFDVASMATAFVKLAEDDALRRSMADASLARYEADFTWDRERTELLNILGLRP